MTPITDLVFLKNQLDKLSVTTTRDQANHSLNEFLYIINELSPNHTQVFAERQHEVAQAFNSFGQQVDALKLEIKQEIEKLEKELFQQSYTLYQDESIYDEFHILGRRWQPNINLELFYARIRKNVDWHYPAMLLRPGYENFIEEMVGFDPLYLVDIKHEFILPAMSKFNERYQRRLRSYVVKEDLTQNILDRLPDNQFGMIVGCHFFNFRPFDIIKKYLTEIYTKLRPGGLLLMTFNDCDRASAVKLVEEKKDGAYTPGYLLFELAKKLGYEINYIWHDNGPQTWLELKKPGELNTIKGGQTLAKIVPK